MSQQNLPLRIRQAIEDDIPFIFNSWLKCFRGGYMVNYISDTIYYANHHKLLQKLVKRSTVFVACNPDDTSQIYGYIVAEHIDGAFVLHFIYVKQSFRKLGIGKALYNSFEHDGSAGCVSHLNRFGEKFLMKYNLVYHPYTALLDEVANGDE